MTAPSTEPLRLKPPFRHVRGHGFEAILPDAYRDYASSTENVFGSRVRLRENGTPLRLPYGDITTTYYAGGGSYMHWGKQLIFSTPDNTDPNTNGRVYDVVLETPPASGLRLPPRVHIELSRSCNIACRICRDKPYRAPFMEPALFDCLAEQLFPTTAELRLDGGGELLMNRDLPAILRTISRYDQPFFVSSNGTLMTPQLAHMLAESPLHHIQISIDSPVRETFEWIRRGARFERVIEGVKQLVAARRDVGRPFLITFHAAVMRENVRQLPDLVRLAHELGAEGVTAMHLYCHAHVSIDPDSSCYWNQAEYDEMREAAIAVARELDSFYYGPAPFASLPPDTVRKSPYCAYPESGVYIIADGSVTPCCAASSFVLGNVRTKPFEAIWNGENYARLRATYRTEQPSCPACRDCLCNQQATLNWRSYFAPRSWQAIGARHAHQLAETAQADCRETVHE